MVRRLAALTAAVVAGVLTLATAGLVGQARADVDPGLAVPAPPSVSVSGDSAIIGWAAVSGAAGYRVQISLDNGARWGDVGQTDASTLSTVARDLRTPSLGCATGPCSVIARVAQLQGLSQSNFSAASAPVALPLPYTIPMSVTRHDSPGRIALTLYGTSVGRGTVLHLFTMDRDRVWQDTGRTTTAHLQRVPGHRRPLVAWRFALTVRAHGRSNFRVEIPAAGPRGEGTSRPYGVRL